MGIADLIPGVSGGTIAFITGVYEELLESIKTLQLHSMKKIAWPFLLPLGAGILTAVFFASRLFYYLFLNHPVPLFAFFFGLILASVLFCGRKAGLERPSHWFILALGTWAAFALAGLTQISHTSSANSLGFFPIALAGFAAAGAMLLPGISGSYLLQLLGVYSFVLEAINTPTAPGSLKLLAAICLGVSLGFVSLSRVVSWLVTNLSTWTYAALVGFMLGGTRSIWPFHQGELMLALIFSLLGFFLVILLEMRMKKSRIIRGV